MNAARKGHKVTLTAADGFSLGGYRADPAGKPRGGVVVLQEIFGVNNHIRSLCDRLAGDGYAALAPALFDRHQRDFESGYSGPEVEHARTYIPRIDWDHIVLDTRAAVDALRAEGPVAVIGFCLGGTVAWLAACKVPGLAAAVGFYGGKIAAHADKRPLCPTLLHFGEQDASIPMADVQRVRASQPGVEVHVYPGAGHGFHCDERGSHEPASSRLAWQRTLDFLAAHMRG